MAVVLTAPALATAANITSAEAVRLLPVASALVLQYAANAPDAIHGEAVARVAGFLAFAPPDAIRATEAGGVSTQRAPSMLGALHSSGAKGVLSPWRRRRAL